jgi:hypothetical protein
MSPLSPEDEDLLAAFERGAPASFRHADHVRMAYLCLRRAQAEAAERYLAALRRTARALGAESKVDEALTRTCVALVAERMAGGARWEAFVAENPDLMTWTDMRRLLEARR